MNGGRLALAFLCIIGSLLSGCLVGPTDSSPSTSPGTAPPSSGATNQSLPPTLPAPTNPWLPDEPERVLFQGSVEAGECYPQAYVGEAVWGGYVMGGCAVFSLPAGTLIPEGTRELRWEADASQALRAGSYYPFLYTRHRDDYWEADTEPSTVAVHTWTIPLAPADWDPPAHPQSLAGLGYWTANDGTQVPLLQGPIPTRLVAVRNQSWVPAAVPDPWRMPEAHAYPQAGVMTLLDVNLTLDCGAGSTGCGEFPELADRLPEGTTRLVFAAKVGPVEGCPATATCSLRTPLRNGWTWIPMRDADDALGPGWRFLTYDVPGQVVPDHPLAESSAVRFFPWLDHCLPGEQTPSCSASGTVALRAAVRVRVEAWRETPDAAAIKARLGIPP